MDRSCGPLLRTTAKCYGKLGWSRRPWAVRGRFQSAAVSACHRCRWRLRRKGLEPTLAVAAMGIDDISPQPHKPADKKGKDGLRRYMQTSVQSNWRKQ